MSFELSPEHEQFRRSVRDFAEKEIAPHAAQWDRDHHFPVDVVHQMGELGLMGLTAPEEYGGAGLTGEDGAFTSLCLAIEEVGRVDQSMGITLEAAVGLGINPILEFGTPEQKERWLPDLVAGRCIAGFGLTEPGAGSDAGATRTKAELLDGHAEAGEVAVVTGAAVLLGGGEAEEAHLPHLLDHVDREVVLPVPLRRVRRDLGLRELADAAAELLVLTGQVEAHDGTLTRLVSGC